MRLRPVDDRSIGEKLGQSIFDQQGRVLLAAGVTLSDRSIGQLQARGYRSIPVLDALAPDAMPVQAIDEQTRARTIAVVAEALQAAEGRGVVVVDSVRRAIDEIISTIMQNATIAVHLSSLRGVHDALLTHSINVAVYSVMLAHSVGFARGDVANIGIGALLHDIGKIYYMDLENAVEDLTPAEQETLQKHTTDGYDLLRRQRDIDLRAAHIAYQHHERLDGSGYPRGLEGDRIHPWAHVVAVCDILDRLIAGRRGDDGMAHHEAMNRLAELAREGGIDPRYVRHLVRRLAAFPEGSIALLESGELSVVIGQERMPPDTVTPRLRIVTDAQLKLIEPVERVASGADAGTSITSVLPDYPPQVYAQLNELEHVSS